MRIASIDGLRAVAILLVLVGHLSATLGRSHQAMVVAGRIADGGRLGVTVFFVLSGYLITSLLQRECDEHGTISLRAFYLRRVLRIFPAFYAFFLTILLLAWMGVVELSSVHLWTAGLFVFNYGQFGAPFNDHAYAIGHLWSLALEEHFYLLWPMAMAFLERKTLVSIAIAVVLGSPLLRVGTILLFPDIHNSVLTLTHAYADPIMAGCLIALLIDVDSLPPKIARYFGRASATAGGFFLLALSPWLVSLFHNKYRFTVGVSLEALAISIILVWSIRNHKSMFGRLLNSSPMRFIGVLSYSLYLWHMPFVLPSNVTWTGKFPANVLCCFLLALLSYFVIERPFLGLKKRWQIGRQGKPLRCADPLES